MGLRPLSPRRRGVKRKINLHGTSGDMRNQLSETLVIYIFLNTNRLFYASKYMI